MRFKMCLTLVLVSTLLASACDRGPSPEELAAPTVESSTIHLMEHPDSPDVVQITSLEIVIDNPNPYEGEIVYSDLDFTGGGGASGTASIWNTTLIDASGLTTLKFVTEPGTQGEPDWIADFPKEHLPFEISGFIRIDFEGVKSFDVTVEGTSGS